MPYKTSGTTQTFTYFNNGIFQLYDNNINLFGAQGINSFFGVVEEIDLPVGLYLKNFSGNQYIYEHRRFRTRSTTDSSTQFLTLLYPQEGSSTFPNPISFINSTGEKYVVKLDSPHTAYFAVCRDSAEIYLTSTSGLTGKGKFFGVQMADGSYKKLLLNDGTAIGQFEPSGDSVPVRIDRDIFRSQSKLESFIACYKDDSLIVQTYSPEHDEPVYKILHQDVTAENFVATSTHHINDGIPPSVHIQNLAYDSLYFYVNYFSDTTGTKHISNDLTFAYGYFYSEIIVDSGVTLTLKQVETGGKEIRFMNSDLIVDGNIHIVGSQDYPAQVQGSGTNHIYLRSSDASLNAKHAEFNQIGIQFGFLDVPATRQCIIDSCRFVTNEEAINLYYTNISITNSLFENCGTAVTGDLCSGTIQNITIKNGTKGLRFNQSSITLANDSLYHNSNYGIYLSFCDNFSIHNSVIEDNGIYQGETDWTLRSGLLLYASSPTLNYNVIRYNKGNGILAFAPSYPLLYQEAGEQNCIQDNGRTIQQSENTFEEAEIYFYEESWPVMDFGHNDVVDIRDNTSCLLCSHDNSIETFHVEGNFWGLNYDEIPSRLVPIVDYSYEPYDEDQNNPATNPGKPPEREMLFSGLEAESEGNFSDAWTIYTNLINQYPASSEAQIALNHKFNIAEKVQVSFTTLKNDFMQMLQNSQLVNLHKNAYRYAYQCDVKNKNYQNGVAG